MRSLAAILLAMSPLSAYAQKPCGDTPVYTACDIAFDLSGATDPMTADLWAEFRSPQYKTYRVAGFWDGARRTVFRITPLEPGAWTYRISGNVRELDGKVDKFTAVAAATAPFIRRENAHHWTYTGELKPHLYLGADEDNSAVKFTHISVNVLPPGSFPDLGFFKQLDSKIAALNAKGVVADLILAPGADELVKRFPEWRDRERYLRYIVARYAPFNVTWRIAGTWENAANARSVFKEIGLELKKTDPYSHPRTTGSASTSAPLGPDQWMDHTVYGSPDAALISIEHQLYNVPQIVLIDAALPAETFRKTLWNAATSGAYPSIVHAASLDAAKSATVKAWLECSSRTRYWDIEPYFDLDGGRALANPGVEYLVYIEHPGKVEVTVEKHSYAVYWIDPATGQTTKEKKEWKGDVFTGTPPDAAHDWVLHLSRDGRKEGMLRSYKFESWPIPVQEPERSLQKAPFDLAAPKTEEVLTAGQPVKFSVQLKRQTAGTRRMTYLITGEVLRDGQGYRVLATAADGSFIVPPVLLSQPEGPMNLRVSALNAPGKVYVIDYVFTVRK